MVEPLVQGPRGSSSTPRATSAGFRELSRAYGTLLIADEVAVGFGRTGTLFACEQEEVSPDFLCLAKGLTGGYLPLAATLTTEEIYSAFRGTHAEGKTFFMDIPTVGIRSGPRWPWPTCASSRKNGRSSRWCRRSPD